MTFSTLVRNFLRVTNRNFSAKCSTKLIRRSFASGSPPGRYLEAGGYNIHYEQIGTGSHIVLLMPGALGSTRTDFSPQLLKFDPNLFTVIAWDPPGYGYSRPPDRKYPLDFFHHDAKIAHQFLKNMSIAKTSVIGWSDGGITALLFAAQNPHQMKKLVVFGANAFITEKDVELYEAMRDIDKWSPRMRNPMIELYGESYFRTKWAEWLDAMNRIYKEKQGDICKKELGSISCTTLILHGAKDPMVPKSHPEYLHSKIKNSRFVEFEDGKHNIHIQHADRFNKTVCEFLLEWE